MSDANERRQRGEPAETETREVEAPQPPKRRNPFAARAITLTEEWLTKRPPERDCLLRRPWVNGEGSDRYFIAGKVGVLVGAGGAGKGNALLQLAVSLVTGEPWLGIYTVPKAGRVLYVPAEDDEDDVRERAHAIIDATWTDERKRRTARAQLLKDLVIVPMTGETEIALVSTDPRTGQVVAQPALEDLKEVIEQRGPFRLVVLDPLSRFAGAHTESDNAAATQFIQHVESLTLTTGRPSVMLAHHSTKAARGKDKDADASNARGATGIIDGVRWASELRRETDAKGNKNTEASLSMTKTNNTPWAPTEALIRNRDGVLRGLTSSERIARKTGNNDDDDDNNKPLPAQYKVSFTEDDG